MRARSLPAPSFAFSDLRVPWARTVLHTVLCVERLGLCWDTAANSILDSSELIAKEAAVAKNLSFPAAVLERQEAAIKKAKDELWSNIRAALAANALPAPPAPRKRVADDALRFEPTIEPEPYCRTKCPKRPKCPIRLAEYHASLPPARGVALPPPVSDAQPPARGVTLPPPVSDALPPARGVALPPPVSDEIEIIMRNIERLHAPPSSCPDSSAPKRTSMNRD